jgi:hypothetical protein
LLSAGPLAHPPFPYPDVGAARAALEEALAKRRFVRTEPDATHPAEDNLLILQLGHGSALRLLSESALHDLAREQAQNQGAARGLILAGPAKPPPTYRVVVQTGAQQNALGFAVRRDAIEAVELGLERGWIHHVETPDENELFLQTGPGTLFIVMSNRSYEFQRRFAIENAMRQQKRGP